MATTEIEKLERRYAENPQGLTFAPLAEVHRKSGDVARALELLRAGLELHPNYIPASIVLGRCHWDLGDLPAAEAAFSHVLRLDDENVIALKSLADINERLERYSDAQRWLNRLISVDRSNEEARQQLARIEAARQGPGKAADIAEIAIAGADQSGNASQSPPQPEASLELTDTLEEPRTPSESKPSLLEFIDTSEPAGLTAEPSLPQEPASVDGLVSQEFVPPKDTSYRAHPELTQEFISGEPMDRLEVETAGEVELQSSGAAEFRVPNAAEDFMEAEPHAPPAADLELIRPVAPPEAPPQPVAQPIYQPKRVSYSARETGGQSVAAFFRTMLTARPSASTSPSAPAREQPLGQGAAARPPQEPVEPAPTVPKDQPSPGVPASGTSPELAVSFDDFFGAPTGGSGPLPKGSTDPGKDDLDQFQSWLQNLKR